MEYDVSIRKLASLMLQAGKDPTDLLISLDLEKLRVATDKHSPTYRNADVMRSKTPEQDPARFYALAEPRSPIAKKVVKEATTIAQTRLKGGYMPFALPASLPAEYGYPVSAEADGSFPEVASFRGPTPSRTHASNAQSTSSSRNRRQQSTPAASPLPTSSGYGGSYRAGGGGGGQGGSWGSYAQPERNNAYAGGGGLSDPAPQLGAEPFRARIVDQANTVKPAYCPVCGQNGHHFANKCPNAPFNDRIVKHADGSFGLPHQPPICARWQVGKCRTFAARCKAGLHNVCSLCLSTEGHASPRCDRCIADPAL